MPKNFDVISKRGQRQAIGRHGVVGEVTCDDLSKPFPSYEGSSVKHQNLSLSGRKPNSDLSRRVLRQPRIRWDISSQTTFPYSGEEFFSGGATL